MYMGLEAEMAEDKAKYRKIFEYLRKEIRDGRYPRGDAREIALLVRFDQILL
jgi:hypothetical protein